jgi:hypothetical protein
VEALFKLRLPLFEQSKYTEVEEMSRCVCLLLKILEKREILDSFRASDGAVSQEAALDIEVREELCRAVEFGEEEETKIEKIGPSRRRRRKHYHYHHHKPTTPPIPVIDAERVEELQARIEHRKSARRKHREKPVEPPKELSATSVPINNSKLQKLIVTEGFNVSAVGFKPKAPNLLGIELQIENSSRCDIFSVDFRPRESDAVKCTKAESIIEGIAAGCLFSYVLTVEVTNIFVLNVLRLLIVPNGGGVEAMEARIRLFPSYFLVDTDNSVVEIAMKRVGEGRRAAKFGFGMEYREKIVGVVGDLLHGKYVADEGLICSKFVTGEFVVCSLKFGEEMEIEVRCQTEELAEILYREIEMKMNQFL